jgi:3-deoxy-D-manno-octulosonic-acid transferase
LTRQGSPPRIPAPLLAFYSFAALLFCAVAAPWFAWRSRRDPALRASLGGRLGRGPRREGGRPCVWFHAVSVGELKLSRTLVDRFAERRPDLDVAVSATTAAGLALAREMHGARPGRFVFEFPLDARFAVRRVFERVRPAALVLVELELWPNVLAEARRRGVPVAVVNARVSDRSFPRYRLLEPIARPFAQIDAWFARDVVVAGRLRELGVDEARVATPGNLKHDALRTTADAARVARLRAECGLTDGARVLVGGSTHPGEEELLVALLPQLEKTAPGLRLLVAPRHVERGGEVARAIERAGRRAALLTELRRTGTAAPADAVVVVDTIGELEAVYALADVVFVGGSLVPRGGQNVLEPAALGKPTLFGPGTANFTREVERLRERAAAVEVADGAALGREIARLLGDPEARRGLGERARAAAAGLQGATERTLEGLVAWLDARAIRG